MQEIILASASPRRRDILSAAGFTYRVEPMDVDESFSAEMDVMEVPLFLAGKKMDAALNRFGTESIIITADTVVVLEDAILGKPENREDGIRILRLLSGKMHLVVSGVCIYGRGNRSELDVTTKVYFDVLSDGEICRYLDTYKPYDKAGAYAIQEWIGMNKITRIEGDYYNVVGFPMSKIYPVLTALMAD